MSDEPVQNGSEKKKEKNGKNKGKGKVDLLAGIVIGGAIGSVLGMTLSPKSGKENRDYVKRKTKDTWKKSKLLLGEVLSNEKKEKGLWHKLNTVFCRKKDGDE